MPTGQLTLPPSIARPATVSKSAPAASSAVVRGVLTGGRAGKKFQKRARKGNPAKLVSKAKEDTLKYLQSLIHPEKQLPVGIPDFLTYPFCPMSLVSKFPVVSDAAGNQLIRCRPYIKEHLLINASALGIWGPIASNLDVSQFAAIAQVIVSYRPVSFSARFTSTLPALTASGETLVGVNGDATNFFSGTNVADVQQGLVEWERCGLNSSPGCRAIWYPRSPNDRDYIGVATAPAMEGTPLAAAGLAQRSSSELVFAFTGLPASTSIGFVETVLNIEGIPKFGDNFLTKKHSQTDSHVMDLAANMMANTSQITPYEAGSSKETTWSLDEILNYIVQGAGVATTAFNAISPLLL